MTEPESEPEMIELKDADDNVKTANQFRGIISTDDLIMGTSAVSLYKSKLNGDDFQLNDIVYISDTKEKTTSLGSAGTVGWKSKIGYYKLIGGNLSTINQYGWTIGHAVANGMGEEINSTETEYLGETYQVPKTV